MQELLDLVVYPLRVQHPEREHEEILNNSCGLDAHVPTCRKAAADARTKSQKRKTGWDQGIPHNRLWTSDVWIAILFGEAWEA